MRIPVDYSKVNLNTVEYHARRMHHVFTQNEQILVDILAPLQSDVIKQLTNLQWIKIKQSILSFNQVINLDDQFHFIDKNLHDMGLYIAHYKETRVKFISPAHIRLLGLVEIYKKLEERLKSIEEVALFIRRLQSVQKQENDKNSEITNEHVLKS